MIGNEGNIEIRGKQNLLFSEGLVLEVICYIAVKFKAGNSLNLASGIKLTFFGQLVNVAKKSEK